MQDTAFSEQPRKSPYFITMLADKEFWFLTSRNTYFCCKYFVCFKNQMFQENHCEVTYLWNLRNTSLIWNIFGGGEKTWGKPKCFIYFKMKCLKMCHKTLLCFAYFGNLIKINYKMFESQQNWCVGGNKTKFLTLSYVSSISYFRKMKYQPSINKI